jgi:rhomboid family GlyGly-CTERM serine protease
MTVTVVFLMPDLAALMLYDRQRILAGEVWRLATGHMVHFTSGHLCFNLIGFLLAGWVVQRRAYAGFWAVCLISALAISGALMLRPEVAEFGGISGVVNAAVVFAATRGLAEKGTWRWFSCAVLLLIAGNSVLESMTGRPTFAMPGDQSFLPVPLAHVVGGLIGALMGMPPWRLHKRQSLRGRPVRSGSVLK